MALDIDTYADESGIERDQGYCLIAGYVNNPHNWPPFENAWKDEVIGHGFSRFKADDFFTFGRAHRYRNGEYGKAKWRSRDSRADEHLDRLHSFIESYGLIPIGAAIPWSVFLTFSDGEQQLLSADSPRKSPYYLAMFSILGWLVARSGAFADRDVKLNLILERQKVLREYAVQAFSSALDDITRQGVVGAERVGRISFDTPTNAVQLQAADLLCYTWRRRLIEGDRCPEEVSKAFDRACRGVGHDLQVWDAPGLRQLLGDLINLGHTVG